MLDCWNEDPSSRPTFDRLHEIKTTFVQEEVIMGPLQLVSHVVQKHIAGEQETHWDKTNRENYHFM